MVNTDNGDESLPDLFDEALRFFINMNFKIHKHILRKGKSGKEYKFDLLVETTDDVEVKKILVKIVDWKRPVGVDRLIKLEHILNDLQSAKGMIIANTFSEASVKFAKRRGIILYSREHLYLAEK
ncbi:MAG: restriction endonuclease [Asgard group archaeon]|nr:restriction endonuclease [Asgard group archaeon]